MRKVFTSPRLENVEAVAALLQDAGIQVKVSEARSYRGKRRSHFSYRDSEDAAPQPAVWIVHAEDQPRGRQLLREAGLLDSSRAGESSYVPLSVLEPVQMKNLMPAGNASVPDIPPALVENFVSTLSSAPYTLTAYVPLTA